MEIFLTGCTLGYSLSLVSILFTTLYLQHIYTHPAAATQGDAPDKLLQTLSPVTLSCNPPIPSDFTIHGIWPQDRDDVPIPPYDGRNPCTRKRPTPPRDLPVSTHDQFTFLHLNE